jgi:putative transposase
MNTPKTELTAEEKELAGIIAKQCKNQGDIHEVLKRLFGETVEEMLEAEMEEHLRYEKNSAMGRNSGNSRNGYTSKRVTSEYGESEIATPRDRKGRFEPVIIEKRQRRSEEIEDKIISMVRTRNDAERYRRNDKRNIGSGNQSEFSEPNHRANPAGGKRVRELTVGRGIRGDLFRRNRVQEPEREQHHQQMRDDSIKKAVYLSVTQITRKWTMPIGDRGLIYSQIIIYFEDRLVRLRSR